MPLPLSFAPPLALGWVVLLLAVTLAACEDRRPDGAAVPVPPETPVSSPHTTADPGGTPPPEPDPTLGLVQGRVTTADGQPLAGVLVAPQSNAVPPEPLPEIAIWTDAQGAYWWSLPPGPYTLTFTREGYQPRSAGVVLQPGQTLDLDVTLERP